MPKRTKGFFRRISSSLEKSLSAVTFAEAGEHNSALDFMNTDIPERTVLLVIEGEKPHRKNFLYALGLCKRTQAELDILQVIPHTDHEDYGNLSSQLSRGSANLIDLVKQLESEHIPFKVTIRLGEVKQKLFNYAKRHRDVSTVILDIPEKESNLKEFIDYFISNLSVSVVTVGSS